MLITFFLQGLESDGLRSHLSLFAESLNKSRSMIYPSERKISRLGEMLPNLAEVVDKEHKRLLARKSVIEKRKEEQERHLLERVSLIDILTFYSFSEYKSKTFLGGFTE